LVPSVACGVKEVRPAVRVVEDSLVEGLQLAEKPGP
jgi:hypothetical protein